MVKLTFSTLLVGLLAYTGALAEDYGESAAGTVVPVDTTTQSTTSSSIPNWVGPTIGAPSDSACYRKTHISKNCSTGYEFDNIATCWAQCPLEYPVECGMECIPQNEDCTLEIISKIESVATVALNAATSGVFSGLVSASKGLSQGVKCAQQLYTVLEKVVSYAEELKQKFPNNTEDQILYLLSNADFVVTDLPVAVTTCLGIALPSGATVASEVTEKITAVLKEVYNNDGDLLSIDTFTTLITTVFGSSSSTTTTTTSSASNSSAVTTLSDEDKAALQVYINSDTTCGTTLNSIINKIVSDVNTIKTTTPDSTTEIIRLAISSSSLVLVDIPAATTACMNGTSSEDFATRDGIRKTLETIVDNIIGASDDGSGKPLSTADFALKVTDMGLGVIATFDPTGLAAMAAEFIQPICGPTSYLGEVDDGDLKDALGLNTIGDAFTGSSGTWTRKGDGQVVINFTSKDTEDVEIVIHSGGNTIDKVKLKKGARATWTGQIADLKDKTMYLDRWRPGILGLPGSGGGSLLMWVPHASEGGHLELSCQLNVS